MQTTFNDVKDNVKALFTLNYYKEGFSNWTKLSRIWWVIGIIILLTTGIHGGTADLPSITALLGGLIGFTCTLAITNKKLLNGLLGFVSAILISYSAYTAGNFADITMQLAYVFVLDIPVILYGRQWEDKPTRNFDISGLKTMILTFAIALAVLYFADTNIPFMLSPRPWIDAPSAAIGITGAVLMLRNYKSQYWMWTLQGVASIILWGQTALSGDANWVLFMTYVLYLGNDVIGLFFSKWATIPVGKTTKAMQVAVPLTGEVETPEDNLK